MNPKRDFRHLLPLMFLALFPVIGQAQGLGYTADQMLPVRFSVQIQGPGDPILGWESITGGAQVMEMYEGAGADQFRVATTVGTYVEELTLRRPMVPQRVELEQWLTEALEGRATPRAVSRTGILPNDSYGSTIVYLEAWPVRYVFPVLAIGGTYRLFESLTVQPTRVERLGPSGGSAGGRPEPGAFLENTGFQVDGLPGDPPMIRAVSIGDLIFEMNGRTDSRTGSRTWSLGRSQVGPMTISVAAGPGTQLFNWWEQSARGREDLRDITVSVLDGENRVARSFTFRDCFPIMYDHGDFSKAKSPTKETITLSIGRVEFNG